jgi:hypothetical protein
MTGMLEIRSVAIVSSELKVRPIDGTGVTQYRPFGEMGG